MRELLLALILLLLAANGAQAFTVNGVSYSVNDGVATVTGADRNITKLVIPAIITYGGKSYPVNFIAGNAFFSCTSLRELVIEDSDTYIGSLQFKDSNGWNQFGNPFKNCPIEKAYVGRNLAKMLGHAEYLADLTPIASTASSLDLTIAGKCTFILSGMDNNLTFKDKKYITSLTIGGSVTDIENYAFSGCTGLKKVTLLPGDGGIVFKTDKVFENCQLDSLVMHRDIAESNSCGGAQINTVLIAEDVKELSKSTFNRCTSIKHFIILDSDTPLVTENAYNYLFGGCVFDTYYLGRPFSFANLFGRPQIKKVIFGPLVTEVEDYCFSQQNSLEEVVLSDNITKIGERAFADCTSLTEIALPESLRVIDNNAFQGCKSLVKADLTPNVETIGSGAFSYNL